MIKKVEKKTKPIDKKTKPVAKKTKPIAKKTKPIAKKTKPIAKKKKSKDGRDDLDIIFVDEDVSIDKESELEARKAYLEEARSQESSGD